MLALTRLAARLASRSAPAPNRGDRRAFTRRWASPRGSWGAGRVARPAPDVGTSRARVNGDAQRALKPPRYDGDAGRGTASARCAGRMDIVANATHSPGTFGVPAARCASTHSNSGCTTCRLGRSGGRRPVCRRISRSREGARVALDWCILGRDSTTLGWHAGAARIRSCRISPSHRA